VTGGGDAGVRAELQSRVTALLLGAVGDAGFVLAGAGAIRQHGLTDRPTEDVDLFTVPTTTAEQFGAALDAAETALRGAGFEVSRSRVSESFARFQLRRDPDGEEVLEVDFGINWRADPPVAMSVGPVLSERDAVAGKLSAVYSRGEVRDFLDLDSIRSTGRFTDSELVALGEEHDGGFDMGLFAAQLSRITTILPTQAAQYDVTADEFAQVQARILAWAVELRDTASTGNTGAGPRIRTTPPAKSPRPPGAAERSSPPGAHWLGRSSGAWSDPPGPSL
jgi:hypothetical protein